MAKKNKLRMDNMWPMVGSWSFIIGLAIAVLASVWTGTTSSTALVLGVLGIIVGVLNIGDRELMLFLLASLAFVASANSLGNVLVAIPGIGAFIPALLGNIVIFVAPAAAVAALRAIHDVARH